MNPSGTIPQSGALCLTDGEIVLVTNKSGTRWVIPKGHLEADDPNPAFRAETEAWEEAGVRGTARPEPLGEYPYQKRGGDYLVTVYVIPSCVLHDSWPEQHQRRRVVVSLKRAAEMVIEPELALLLKSVAPMGRSPLE